MGSRKLHLPQSDEDRVYNWLKINMELAFWEASRTYPAKINPSNPNPPTPPTPEQNQI